MNKFESYSRFLPWFMALLLSAFVAGCGGGGGGQDPILGAGGGAGAGGAGAIPAAPPGAIPPGAVCTAAAGPTIPTVTASDPTNGNQFATTSTSGVAPSKLITATFSLPMNPATINATTFTLTPVGGTALVPLSVTYSVPTRVATFRTQLALNPNTSYTATITQGAMSAAGTPLSCIYAWNFKTVIPAATGVGPINLGLATPFALASAGGMTNSGATKINGNVVLDPNQTCNFVPVGSGNDFGLCPANPPTHNAGDTVITQIFPDTTTADAVIAALNATWISIAPAALPGATVLGCGTIGSLGAAGAGIGCSGNATLPPGVYISATSSTIGVTGNLTLDAGGNPDAVWVFQAPSALTMNVGGTSIILAGGAKASNVWWFVGSSASLNTGVSSNGNILASAAITMGTGATSCGRLLAGATGAGNFTMLANTVSVPGHPNAPAGCQ